MNPLSPLTYYRRHKGGTALLIVIVALVTLAVGTMVSVLDSFIENMFLDIAYLDTLSAVYPTNASDELDPGIAAQVRTHPDVEQVIPESGMTLNHPALIGSNWVRMVVIPVADMSAVLRVSGLCIAEGRLPAVNAPELALSVDTARALGLHLGDRASRALNPDYYWSLPSEITVVGLLDQDPAAAEHNVRLGLMSYEYVIEHEGYGPRMTGLLVIPRPGRIVSLNRFLETLPASLADYETQDDWAASVRRMDTMLRLVFAFVDVLVAGVVAVVMGVINQLAIARRLPEFGLLQAVGWRKGALLRRVTGGTAMTAAFGWLVGLAGMVVLVSLGRQTIFAARGQEWSLSLMPFLYTLPIPLAVVAFAAGSVWWVFRRLDAVAIVERGKLSMEEAKGKRREAKHSSVKPLSSWTFYLRHRRRGFLLVAAMALMIVGVAFPVFILLPIFDTQLPRFEYLRYVSLMSPAGREVDPGILAQVRAHPGVARLIPTWVMDLGISVPPFSQSSALVFAVTEEDMPYLMERFGLRLLEGRLPRPRTNEVVISEALALNRGLHIGDFIGNPVYDRDGSPVALTIVGLLETDGMWMGFASLEFIQSHELTADRFTTSQFVVPAADKAALDTWLVENVDSNATVVLTYDKERERFLQYRKGGLGVLAMVLSLVAVIAAVALAVLNYIFYSQRRDEFGVLHAVGRGQGWLTWRAGRETLFTTTAAWLVGAALCMGVILCLQLAVYVPKGLSLDLTSIAPWLFTLPIPLAVSATSVGAIGWMLKRLDAVAVIEGR
jgi:ABC-type lipoprotein release transport system permease subunit